MRQLGGDVTAILEQSIRNDWRDVYPLKTQSASLFSQEPEPRRIKSTVGVPHD